MASRLVSRDTRPTLARDSRSRPWDRTVAQAADGGKVLGHHLPRSRDELLDRQADIAGYPAKQNRREVAALVDRNRRGASIRMAEPLVRTPLADFLKAETLPSLEAVRPRGSD